MNIVSVLDGGPYVVFAPTNEAFAKLDEATLATLKNDPTVLLPTLFYHMVLGYLGPQNVAGKMLPRTADRSRSPVRAATSRSMTPRRCAPTAPKGAYIYMIDTVLTPAGGGFHDDDAEHLEHRDHDVDQCRHQHLGGAHLERGPGDHGDHDGRPASTTTAPGA